MELGKGEQSKHGASKKEGEERGKGGTVRRGMKKGEKGCVTIHNHSSNISVHY